MKKIKDKKKLRALLSQIDPDEVESVAEKNFEDDLSYIVKKLDNLKDSSNAIALLQSRFEEFELNILQKIANLPMKSSVEEIKTKGVTLSNTISLLDDRIEEVDGSLHKEFNSFSGEIRKLLKEFQDTNNITKSELDEIRIQSLGNRGGGSIPLQVSAGGTVANTRFAEINFVGATASTNNTTKKTDITIGGFTITPITIVAGQVAYTGITVLPKYVATDSSILKANFGYTLTGVAGNYTVTFDITPQSWADIIS